MDLFGQFVISISHPNFSHAFQLFRETKENEIQALLRARRDLENKLAKLSHGIPVEEGDNGSRIGLEMMPG